MNLKRRIVMKKTVSILLSVLLLLGSVQTAAFAQSEESLLKELFYNVLLNGYPDQVGPYDEAKLSYTEYGEYNGYRIILFEEHYDIYKTKGDFGVAVYGYKYSHSINERLLAFKDNELFRLNALEEREELTQADAADLYIKYYYPDDDSVFVSSEADYVLRKKDENSVEILRYAGTSYPKDKKELFVPESVDGYMVTEIGKNAYSYCYSGFNGRFYVTVPTCVTKIDKDAFGAYGQYKVIYGKRGSYAEEYAKLYGLDFRQPGEYPDTPADAWYYEAVRYNSEREYMVGLDKDHFCPARVMQRQDFALVLARLSGEDYEEYDTKQIAVKYTDVGIYAYYSTALAWATQNGIIFGYQNKKFGVGDPITREQACTIFYRYFGSPEISNADELLNGFTDADSISPYAVNAMAWCIKNNIIVGTSQTTLSPLDYASRAQIAAIIMRMDIREMFGVRP